MSCMIAIDTNIWIYSHDSRDLDKNRTAMALIAAYKPLALPWQVGCEFVAASRKLSATGFTEGAAWRALEAMQAAADLIVLPVANDWSEARRLQSQHSLSFWDSLLVASCLRAGISTLYSEDMGGQPAIEGLRIVNPFTVT